MIALFEALLSGGRTRLPRLRTDEDGATAVEYGLLVALIAGVVVAAVLILGTTVVGWFDSVNATPW